MAAAQGEQKLGSLRVQNACDQVASVHGGTPCRLQIVDCRLG
jgi:hypothetical protein